ncbi:MAG TPA: leucyl aminopeptidase family protein [Gammaproteobacteria bacterium]|nr:leucyl aminopeptidase family protein [Gammaproteobacteria bacterium]
MIEIPRFAPLRITQRTARPRRDDFDSSDHVFVIVPRARAREPWRTPLRSRIERLADLARRQSADFVSSRLDNRKNTLLTVARAPQPTSPFARLSWARKLVQPAREGGGRVAILVLGCDDERYAELIEAVLSALAAASFRLTSFKSKRPGRALSAAVVLGAQVRIDAAAVSAAAAGNDIARWLTALPPNVLDAAAYRSIVEAIAAQRGFEFEFIGEPQLEELGAGAFLAVSQGNDSRDAGIARLRYAPETSVAKLALIGKGIVFDTGGNNLKPFRSMLDMHMDMQGSGVALGLMVALALAGAPCEIETWLAITENRISARAYKSQDVVKAANGTTIQVIHTDAEGRMVLADALALAARSEPDFMIDYATLTGACVTALTSRYSGAFSNRSTLHDVVIEAGRTSGERVWPFPMDEDFDESLSSDIADVKQCSEDGAGDHILAARFLSRFVPREIPWLHVDLAAAAHKGGLGHVPSEFTGFGIRFTLQLLRELRLSDGLAGLAAT